MAAFAIINLKTAINMNGDTDPLSSMLRPFEPLPFTPRTPGEVEAGLIRETDAHAALQSELASGGLSRMTPELADNLLSRFGVEGEQARAILIELWQHAYKKLLFRDDQVDRGEDDYLEGLQRALGLNRDEIRRARAEVPDVEDGLSSA